MGQRFSRRVRRCGSAGRSSIGILLGASVAGMIGAGYLFLSTATEHSTDVVNQGGPARLIVFCPVNGARANLDGKDLGSFPLDLEVTSKETHWLKIEAPRHAPDVQSVELEPGEERTLEIELRALTAGELKSSKKVRPLVVRGLVSDDAFQRAIASYRQGRFGTAKKQLLTISRKAGDPSVQGAARTMARYVGQFSELKIKLENPATPDHELAGLAQKALSLDKTIDPKRPHAGRIYPRYIEGLLARGMRALKQGQLRAARKDFRACLGRDSGNNGCLKGKDDLESAAKRLYYKAYMKRKKEPAEAAKMLKEVIAVLPKSHEIRGKAEELMRTVGSPGR